MYITFIYIYFINNCRSPEAFAGKKVACLGAGPSGIDIAVELANVCPEVGNANLNLF